LNRGGEGLSVYLLAPHQLSVSWWAKTSHLRELGGGDVMLPVASDQLDFGRGSVLVPWHIGWELIACRLAVRV